MAGPARAGLLDAIEHGDQSELNRALRRSAERMETDAILVRVPGDVERLLGSLAVGARYDTTRRARIAGLIAVVDEVVDGWRFLAPVDGPNPLADEHHVMRQSTAAGLSWLVEPER